ncbi:RecQ family ATP-dependent DNA helicase [Acidothermaceae bacterium B102]|nr:RecQ family ATP-dependent DNA helicase [Acidothermaceae bacterium B102]
MTAAPLDESLRDQVLEVARLTFGYAALRPGQLDAILSLLAGQDTLVVMPTGWGKSAVYQIAALLLDGPTVVVSPLISLQRDQVASLLGRVGTSAVSANSSQSRSHQAAAFDAISSGSVEFLFLSPEQLAKRDVVDMLRAARPSLFVVDEAHCVSAWGHDFRPDYLRLGAVIEQLGRPRVVALTATASPPVRTEIIERLRLRDPRSVIWGFDRPNLRLSVESFRDEELKREAVELRAAAEAKPGIVYVATRKDAEAYAAELHALGLRAAPYHGGMRAADREDVQERFMTDQLDVVVATTAFGMGIDKPNVRFVLHADVPDSVDTYYQEIGRSGRDGLPAEAVLFYRQEDFGLRKFFASGSPDEQALRKVMTLVRLHQEMAGPVSPDDLREAMHLSSSRLTALVNLLEQAGALLETADGLLEPVGELDAVAAARGAMLLAEAHRRVERSRVEMMRGYADTQGCRRQYLLSYFGEHLAQPCGHCDTCAAGTAEAACPPEDSPYPLLSAVRHADWGEGVVMRYEGDRIVVLFEEVGYRTLSLDAVAVHGLISPG